MELFNTLNGKCPALLGPFTSEWVGVRMWLATFAFCTSPKIQMKDEISFRLQEQIDYINRKK